MSHFKYPQHCVSPTPDGGQLEIRAVLVDGTRAYFQLSGELDLATARFLNTVLAQHFFDGRRFVRLDLSGLRFLDCAGLRALVGAHNECLSLHGTLVLTHVGQPAARLLELTGLDGALFISDGVSDARRGRPKQDKDARPHQLVTSGIRCATNRKRVP
jgi:anti-anti-sigma factor